MVASQSMKKFGESKKYRVRDIKASLEKAQRDFLLILVE
jgi:hypothetical protein